ncbi:MAG: discoidin domain-containing protein [Bacteroidales bacterium]|nr:discoidin domain-containing protein [Bacteroidales bacterium]
MKKNPKIHQKTVTALIFLLAITGIIAVMCKGPSNDARAALKVGFLTPPESAKPRVWWHWMNGNITKEGIKADLEWMKRVGIGGFHNFDASLSTPQIVEKRLVYMTPEWKDAFLFTTKLADSLGLEMGIASSPGWSGSGGPWVTPAQAMKKFVWSETRVKGGQPFRGTLTKPPTATGTFQNIGNGESKKEYYADAAVVAYRVPENDIPLSELKPKVTSSSGKFNLTELIDNDLAKSTFLPAAPPNGKSWIQFEFAKPETIQSITIVIGGRSGRSSRALEASDDGRQFKTVLEITGGGGAQNTITFPPVTARFFRLTFTTPAQRPAGAGFGGSRGQGAATPDGTQIAELVLHTNARVNRFEDKAGFTATSGIYALATPSVPVPDAINKDEVVDLTSKMQPDGTLNWTPPAGSWIVMRLGYSLTGKENHPASLEATGLEVDKLSSEHVKAYYTNYLDQFKDATAGLIGKKGLRYIVNDCYEAGVQNWTDSMMAEFIYRRGYDILPWLPVLSGHIVESAEASDRFLWDFRKTIADLNAENHYDQLTTLLHERGMGRYTASHEFGRALVADGMEIKRKADIPMNSFWTPGVNGEIRTLFKASARESASVAHIYGQNLVSNEALTTANTDNNAWAYSPERLKPTADMELANGVNLFIIHTSAHQPVDDKIPGLGLGPYGQWFTRHETWAEQAEPWTTYLSRSSFMLQQGKFVADVIYFYGEDNNIVALFGNKLPDIPSSYNYDFTNADALSNVLSVDKGQIITPSGMSYNLLALDPNCKYMSLPVLRKISEMVKSGAVLVGDKPVGTPSLKDDQTEFKTIADHLWKTGKGENTFGKGKVYAGQTIAEVLASIKITPDFEYTKPRNTTNVKFVHRKLGDVEIYWVNNCNNDVENIEATFRVEGKAPELWHPETGVIEEISYNIVKGRTTVPMRLEPNDAVFIVFSKKAATTSLTLSQPIETQLAVIDGTWNVSFQQDRGAPAQIVLDKLTSWSEDIDPGVKYFSGTGNYTKIIQASNDWFKEGTQIWLDLGVVKNLAEVVVNGKSLGIVWKLPFRVNVTESLKQGENVLEVKVTNLWVNSLIGDQQPGNAKKITYTTQAFYQASSPLLPSGLLGPVKIVRLN